jgi:hypothetical protein
MMIIAEIYLLIATLFLAGKDASSYLLKSREDGPLTRDRVRRWHRDGVALFLLYIIGAATTLFFYGDFKLWLVVIYSVLIRLSAFDLAFNYWAGLDIKFLGSTSNVDKFFVKILGKYGAIKKSTIFLIILIILNIFLN